MSIIGLLAAVFLVFAIGRFLYYGIILVGCLIGMVLCGIGYVIVIPLLAIAWVYEQFREKPELVMHLEETPPAQDSLGVDLVKNWRGVYVLKKRQGRDHSHST